MDNKLIVQQSKKPLQHFENVLLDGVFVAGWHITMAHLVYQSPQRV